MNKNISFIINGKVRKIDWLQKRICSLFTQGFEINFYITQGEKDGMRMAREAAAQHGGYVIAVGGDGMLNEVVNGLLQVGKARGAVIAGVLPYGSGNDFSRTAGVDDNPAGLLELIQNNSIVDLDVGVAEFTNTEGNPERRFFMNITDIGLGGEVVQNLSAGSKIFGANFAYHWAIIKGFFSYQRKRVRLFCPGFEWEGPLLSLVMANGRFFGSGLCIAPQADPADGLLQLVILGEVSVMDYLRKLSSVRKGELIDHPEVQYRAVPSLQVVGLEQAMPIDMDGEYVGVTPLKVGLLGAGLRFLCRAE